MKAAVSAELDLLSDLDRQGVQLWHARGRLRYRGPRGTVDAVLPILRERRDALLALLSPPLDATACPMARPGLWWRLLLERRRRSLDVRAVRACRPPSARNSESAPSRLAGVGERRAMSTPTRRPRPGELARVGDLSGRFRVLEFDGTLYSLETASGARFRAGFRAVRLATQDEHTDRARDGDNAP